MDDLGFVQKIIKGDKQSWDEFVDKYSRLIYNYIYNILKPKFPELAVKENLNDIFQDIFLSLSLDNFRKLKSFKAKNGCSLASWLRQVTINYTFSYLRRVKPLVSLDEVNKDGLKLGDTVIDRSLSVLDELKREDELSHLKSCIEQLDSDDKYFLELHMNRGLNLEIMKDLLGISRGAIDMRKSRLLDRLKACFKSKGFLS